MDIRIIPTFIFSLFLLLIGFPALSLTCENVISVDKKHDFEGALAVTYGCLSPEVDIIKNLQKHKNATIRSFFSNTFYVGAMQPKAVPKEKWLDELRKSIKAREPQSILRIIDWFDAGYENQNFKFEDLRLFDPESRAVFNIYRAAGSLVADESEDYAWQLSKIDAVGVLLQSKSIPIAADYLSYAYLNGYGVITNLELADNYNKIAAKILPEAKRYSAIIAEQEGADIETVLSYFRSAAQTGYVSAILELSEKLKDLVEYDQKYKKEFLDLFSILEVLGYAGHSEAQAAIAQSYLNGVGVSENVKIARHWYTKAAENGDLTAMQQLMTWSAEEGDYSTYIKYALSRAKWGHVEIDGYLAAILGVHASSRPEKDKLKIIQFILDHCIQNIYVGTSGVEICSNYPVRKVQFQPGQDLLIAANAPQDIKFLNDLRLQTGTYRALLIANEDYEFWSDLDTPIADVEALEETLNEDYSFDVKVLKNASRKEILSEIYHLGANAAFDDHVLIYYAGHGIVDSDTKEGYWIPSAADQSFRPDWVSNSEIRTALKSIKSKHLLVMADSCYSGTLVRSGTQITATISNSVIKRLFSKKARVAITSGGNEPVVDSLGGASHSVFAGAFLEALNNNSEFYTPASVFFSKIREKVTRQANQTPLYSNISELDDDGGEFVFKKTQ